jgi:hypothetical protein
MSTAPPQPGRTSTLLALAGLAVGLVAASAGAAAFDWAPFAEEDVVEILTVDPDGERRETKIWIVVIDGAGYIRTNDSRWLANLRRDPDTTLRVRGEDFPMRVAFVQEAAQKARIEAAFKAKYGFVQRVMSFFRMREPTVMRVVPRSAEDASGES